MKQAKLYNTKQDASCIISLDVKTVITENIKKGKSRITQKEFPSTEEATKQYIKKRWETLKKGSTEKNENAQQGEAQLHYLVGLEYTGSLAFAETPEGIFIYKHGTFNTPEEGGAKDYLSLIDRQGNLKETIALPQPLVWNMIYHESTNSLLLDLDHYIYKYSLANKTFTQLTERKVSGSVLSPNLKTTLHTAHVQCSK